ncbi:hypothetical protein [Aquisphaera insulae]|uniref:hypothetical protein n=1 Tax=Aquisphaera insulae TaxID=2712864 RepID=UPI0013ED329F|nr:hypothetical protein [Aquisphaera insulae]
MDPAASKSKREDLPSTASASSTTGWIRDLEELRRTLLLRIQLIEDQARKRPSGGAESTRAEAEFRRKVEELERERDRLLEDSENQATNWKERLERLEDDRKLLSDAWQKLERERIEAAGAGRGRQRASSSSQVTPPVAAGHQDRTRDGSAAANPVAESILRQFQTLCQDVRRASDMRGSPR